MIDKNLLKEFGLHRSVSLSDRIRIRRNRFINAIMSLANSIVATAKRQTHTCNNTTKLPGQLLLDDVITSSGNASANAAHKYALVTHSFFAQFLNRDSIDGKGMTLISSVNYDKELANAFWNSKGMAYGDGDGKYFIGFANDITVVAHELSHGVTQHTCGLWYQSESGAANESFSDVIGVCVRHWNEGQNDPLTANWLIGDKCVGPKFPGKALRSFKNEKAYDNDPQPKHMKNKYNGSSDNFGVHYNSGILNRAFFELCVLMNEHSYGRPLQIKWSAHQTLKPWSGFKAIAKAEYKAALALYGKDVADKVKQAYSIVGISI